MKKKILSILIILICFSLITILFINQKRRTADNNVTNSAEENSTKVVFGLYNNETSAPTINVNGENTGVYIGQDNNFTYYSLKINKEATSEEQVTALIQGISEIIGYNIEINSIQIEDSKIKIDFSSSAAPFELESSYSGGGERYHIIGSKDGILNIILDSICKTLSNYFGEGTEIYYSVDGTSITSPTEIDMNTPYEP